MLVSFDEPPNAVKVRVGGVADQRLSSRPKFVLAVQISVCLWPD